VKNANEGTPAGVELASANRPTTTGITEGSKIVENVTDEGRPAGVELALAKETRTVEKWKELKTYFREASTQSSQILRQLTLAGIGLAWLFRSTTKEGVNSIPITFAIAAGLLSLAVLVDVLQYYYTSWVIDDVLEAGEAPEIPPKQMRRMHGFFHVKFIVGAAGILSLAFALAREIVIRL
jgi:hypothetical protein